MSLPVDDECDEDDCGEDGAGLRGEESEVFDDVMGDLSVSCPPLFEGCDAVTELILSLFFLLPFCFF